jgi:uncharacterized protein (DUF1499 family)
MGAAVFAGLALLCFVAGPLLARTEAIPSMAALALLALSAGLGLVSAELGLMAVVYRRAEGLHYVGFLGLIPVAVVAAAMVQGLVKYPAINDIATDLDDPPEFRHAPTLPENQGRDMAFPAANEAAIRKSYPDLQPLTVEKTPETVYEAALNRAKATGNWTITQEFPDDLIFEGVAVTPMLRFRDDFVVRIRSTDDGGAVVDMRSKSRKGKGDLGANAARIRTFLADLEQAMRE